MSWRESSGNAPLGAGAANIIARRAERAAETQRRLEEGRAAAQRAAAQQAAQAASRCAAAILRRWGITHFIPNGNGRGTDHPPRLEGGTHSVLYV